MYTPPPDGCEYVRLLLDASTFAGNSDSLSDDTRLLEV